MVYIMQFVLSSTCRNCGIVFYDNQTGKEVKRIPFSEGFFFVHNQLICEPKPQR